MNEEEAIEILIELSTFDYVKLEDGDTAIETVLNLIEKQQAEIEDCKKCILRDEVHNYIEELEKKDKIIDLMSYAMTHEEVPQDEYCIFRNMECEVVGGNRECKQCIKQYFERRIEQ